MKKDKGTEAMQKVWDAIRIGADSYLNRQLKTILPAIALLAVALFFSVYIVPPSREALHEFPNNTQIIIAVGRTAAFILGATFSMLVGQLGMRMAIQANVRVASASRRGFNEALSIAYYAGTVTGMLTDGLGLLGGTIIIHHIWYRCSRCFARFWLWWNLDRIVYARGRGYLHQGSGCWSRPGWQGGERYPRG